MGNKLMEMKIITMRGWLISSVLFICACSGGQRTNQASSQINNVENTIKVVKIIPPLPKLLGPSYFGERQIVVPVEDVYLLTDEQKQHFLKEFNSERQQSVDPHRRIYRYLESHLNDFNYYSNTVIASESLARKKGNCLSLAILTKSLADIAEVDLAYQLVETEPVYKKEGNIVVTSQHIRSVLFAPTQETEEGWFLVFRGRIYIDYFPTYNTHMLREVDEAEFESMYYTNMAAEFMIQGNDNKVYWYLKKSLELKPNASQAINMMALLHERVGYPDYAERLYQFGLQHATDDLDLLNNYHSLLKKQNRIEDAKNIAQEIGRRNDANPYQWISLGNTAYNTKEYTKAIRYYRKASELAPYLHEPFAGIARAKIQQKKPGQAANTIKKAINKVRDEQTRKMYRAKLNMLTELLKNNKPVAVKEE